MRTVVLSFAQDECGFKSGSHCHFAIIDGNDIVRDFQIDDEESYDLRFNRSFKYSKGLIDFVDRYGIDEIIDINGENRRLYVPDGIILPEYNDYKSGEVWVKYVNRDTVDLFLYYDNEYLADSISVTEGLGYATFEDMRNAEYLFIPGDEDEDMLQELEYMNTIDNTLSTRYGDWQSMVNEDTIKQR